MSDDAPPLGPGWNLPGHEASAPPSYDSLDSQWSAPGQTQWSAGGQQPHMKPPAGFGSTYYGPGAGRRSPRVDRQAVQPTAPPPDHRVSLYGNLCPCKSSVIPIEDLSIMVGIRT